MNGAELLSDAVERIRSTARDAVDGLSDDALAWRPDTSSNSIAWLVWHLARVQDDHVAGVAGHEQVWTADGWARRFDLPFDDAAIGYGQSSDEVGAVRASADLLAGYVDAVVDRTLDYLRTVSADDFDRVVDDAWDPPVTLAVRLVSVLSDDLQHAGQAAYVRGLHERA